MPNWCHDTLTVTGPEAELARFVEFVKEPIDDARLQVDYVEYLADLPRPSVEQLGNAYADNDENGGAMTFEQYAEDRRKSRSPLSFATIEPFDPAEWPDTYKTCDICDGTGERPGGREQFGDQWYESCNGCNGCHGEGTRVDDAGWYRHHIARWGTKWDASFGSVGMVLGSAGADVDASLEAQGVTITPTVAVYKFDTAWSPPSAWAEHASAQFPDLELRLQYAEPGGDYAGVERYVGGVLIDSEELDVDDVLAPEELWF